MEGKPATNRTTPNDGGSSICREILRLAFTAEVEATAIADSTYREKMCILGVGENNGMETSRLGGLNNEFEAVQGGGRGGGSCRVVKKKEPLDSIVHLGISTGVNWHHMGRLITAALAFGYLGHKIAFAESY